MMAAATGRPQLTAATGHSPCTSARVVFINIDWKASRHSSAKALKRNMQTLGQTIGGVVRNMRPTMICMCEVGEATRALSSKEMKQVADRCMLSWQDAATEHFQLQSMYDVGAPFMTIYQQGPIQCSGHRILRNLYPAQGQPRTAQTFLCTGPGGVTVDIINVHAPSRKPSLTDFQAREIAEEYDA